MRTVVNSTFQIMAEDDSRRRVGFFSHKVARPVPGDHIYVHRALSLNTHHGIFVGEPDCEVIHLSSVDSSKKTSFVMMGRKSANAQVQKSSLSSFCDDSGPRLVAYGCDALSKVVKRSGTCYVDKSRSADRVIATAKYYLRNPDEWPDYNVDSGNFAYYCKTGKDLTFGGVSRARTLIPSVGVVSDIAHSVAAKRDY